MDRAEDKSAPQDPGVAQLGTFIKLPLELRWMIWESTFDEIDSAPCALAILRCSQYLYREISDHLFEDFEHELRVESGLRFNFTIKKRRSQGWELKNIDAIRNHLHTFPWAKVGGKMPVNIVPPQQEDPGQIVQIWQKVNQLVDILKTMSSPPSVWVSLLEDWSRDDKPQESVAYTNGYRPDHDIAIIPFTRLSNWCYQIPPAYSATIMTEQELPEKSQSLLYKHGNGFTLNEWRCIATAPKNWLTHTRIFLDRKLDDIPGKTAGALRLKRFQNWFQDNWESEYEKEFITDLQKHRHIVLKHDPTLRGATRRHNLLIMLHHIHRASHDKKPWKMEAALKEERPRIYKNWDPQVWWDWDHMPSLSYRLANGKMNAKDWRLTYRGYQKVTVFGMILVGAIMASEKKVDTQGKPTPMGPPANNFTGEAASAEGSNPTSPVDGRALSDTTSSTSTSGTDSSGQRTSRITQVLIPLVRRTNETLERSRLIVSQEPTDNEEDLADSIGQSFDLADETRDLEKTVRSQEFYLRYVDYMGRVWKCLELTSRHVPGFWPSRVVAIAEMLELEEELGGGEASDKLAGVLQRLGELGLSVSSDVAKKAIIGYARRNQICHGAPHRLNDKDTRNTIASHVDGLERLLPDEMKADREHWTCIVNLWKECGEYLEDVRKSAPETSPSPSSSHLLAKPPRSAKQKREFTQALETGLFQDELDQLCREGGSRRQDTPPRTRESTRSDPFDGVPSKRKPDLTPSPASLRPLKRQK
ncbi:unnamed protein product [Penicillium glandicola]